MPEDMMKTSEKQDTISGDVGDDIRELRGAVQDLGKLLKKIGRKSLSEVGDEFEEQSENLMRHGRQTLDILERRVVQLEKNVEGSLREHPGAWAGGLLGVIGFGLILGMLTRRNH